MEWLVTTESQVRLRISSKDNISKHKIESQKETWRIKQEPHMWMTEVLEEKGTKLDVIKRK